MKITMVSNGRLIGVYVLCLVGAMMGWSADAQSAEAVRYGAKVVRAELGLEPEKPRLRIVGRAGQWKLKEGEAFTGVNAREFFFTVESTVQDATPPRIEVEWPGVKVARVLGAEGLVSNTIGGVSFRLARRRAPTKIGTSLTYGSVHMHIFHNWIVRRAGFYRKGAWPANQIQAQLNFLFAAREMCQAMGYADSDEPGFRGDIRLYGFETNFPNGHKDHPPHFHIMLGWPGWNGTQVGHFLLDEHGRILKNVLMSNDGQRTVSTTYMPGDVAPMRDPDGKVGFEVMIMSDGSGVMMRRAAGQPEFCIRVDNSAGDAMKGVAVCRREPETKPWKTLCFVRVEDAADRGQMCVDVTDATGKVSHEAYSYDVDTGVVLKAPLPGTSAKTY